MSEELTKSFEKKIEELYNSLMEKPLQILTIFNDFFGEDKIDMQGYCSLEEFKHWIYSTPIFIYTSNNIINIDKNDWINYHRLSINNIPENCIEEIINKLTSIKIKDIIGKIKFSEIYILIHFPHVRITNENDRFVDINDLWAKIKITYDGTMIGKFTLNRSEYSILHFSSNYLHSHVMCIPKDDFTNFKVPCTGSGPINSTINILNIQYDEDIWNLFCLELDKFVSVESIAGVPYHHLEEIGTNNMEMCLGRFTPQKSLNYYGKNISHDKLKEFVKHFINSKTLKFNYVNGSYSIGMSFTKFIILISNEFIKWYNDQFNKKELKATFKTLKNDGILKECIISNERIYYDKIRENIDNYNQYIGAKVCTFKGKDITINIIDLYEVKNKNMNVILNINIALYILTTILKVLNYRYGRSKAIQGENQLGTEVRYL